MKNLLNTKRRIAFYRAVAPRTIQFHQEITSRKSIDHISLLCSIYLIGNMFTEIDNRFPLSAKHRKRS